MSDFQKILSQILKSPAHKIYLNPTGHAIGGNIRAKRKRRKKQARTSATKNTILKRLEARYRKLYNSSLKLKESKTAKKRARVYFCDKYSKWEDFLSVHAMRGIAREEAKQTSHTINRKRTIWGRK